MSLRTSQIAISFPISHPRFHLFPPSFPSTSAFSVLACMWGIDVVPESPKQSLIKECPRGRMEPSHPEHCDHDQNTICWLFSFPFIETISSFRTELKCNSSLQLHISSLPFMQHKSSVICQMPQECLKHLDTVCQLSPRNERKLHGNPVEPGLFVMSGINGAY